MKTGGKFALVALLLLGAVAVAAVLFFSPWRQETRADAVVSARLPQPGAVALPKPEPLEYQPLTEAEALEANAALPFSGLPLETARGVNLLAASYDEISQRNALDCMTAAIFYEAGYEPDQGKRAVAQVILNRVRHPAFPNSVCAVVYQGSERVTGCQFTFTCDGSLARRPPRAAWEAARTIARLALSGAVEPGVGMATHYHANYVVPYWAPSLDKIASIGSHLFYKWKGGWGRRAAFNQLPTGEPLGENTFSLAADDSELPGDDLASDMEQVVLLPSPILADAAQGLTPPQPARATQLPPALSADRAAGTLIADETRGTLEIDRQADR